jgi:hypothetical protein
VRCGIEFEYLLIDVAGAEPGRIRDFGNLPFTAIQPLLEDKPGRLDPGLATGDLGIRSGYWYLEGDERFHVDGSFRTLEVKGVEIRTPPSQDVAQALARLLAIERRLAAQLAGHGLGLGIVGFNPLREAYRFDPPLNPFEEALRRDDRCYDGSHVSTLSYGPDINLSMPGWEPARSLAVARRLNGYSPYIVPFSFSSPFAAGGVWSGCSRRTWERHHYRPAVKLYLAPEAAREWSRASSLVHPARLAQEAGRIEFKAFDAQPSLPLLAACCHLLVGICLADDLPEAGEETDGELYRRAALEGFDDPDIRAGAGEVLARARLALVRAGDAAAIRALAPLEALLARRRTPAHALLDSYHRCGRMYRPGGHAQP